MLLSLIRFLRLTNDVATFEHSIVCDGPIYCTRYWLYFLFYTEKKLFGVGRISIFKFIYVYIRDHYRPKPLYYYNHYVLTAKHVNRFKRDAVFKLLAFRVSQGYEPLP